MVADIFCKFHLSETENHFKIVEICIVFLSAANMGIGRQLLLFLDKSSILWYGEISVHMVATGSDDYITPSGRREDDAFTCGAAS